MKKNKGFTLVELLAVIVVLSLIMVLAIPTILHFVEDAKKQSFYVYANKVYEKAVNKYVDNENYASTDELACSVYRIPEDLDISNSGDYKGWVKIEKTAVGSGNYKYTVPVSSSTGLYSVKYCTKYNADCDPEDTNDSDPTYHSDYWSVKEDVEGRPDTNATVTVTEKKDYHLCVQYQYPNGSGVMQKSTVICNYTSEELLSDTYEYKVTLTMKDNGRAVENFVMENNTNDTNGDDHSKQAMFAAMDSYKTNHNMSNMSLQQLVCSGTPSVITDPNDPRYTQVTTSTTTNASYTNGTTSPTQIPGTTNVTTQAPVTRPNSILINNINVEGYNLGFTPTHLVYSFSVPYSVTSLNITYSKASSDVGVEIVGADNISVGSNLIVLHAWNDSTAEEIFYYITVYRVSGGTQYHTAPTNPVNTTVPRGDQPDPMLASSNAKLSNIAVSGYELSDVFSPDTYVYDIEIDPFVSELQISPVLQEITSRYDISGNNNLQEGSKITITVYSQNGFYHNIYTLTVHVKKKSSNSTVLLRTIAVGLCAVLLVLLVMIKKQKDSELKVEANKSPDITKGGIVKPTNINK